VGSNIESFAVDQEIHWIDDEPASEELKKELLEQAEEFLDLELEYQEELFNQENETEEDDENDNPK